MTSNIKRKPFIVRQTLVAESTARIPALEEAASIAGDIDLFIVCAGFEDRVLAFPEMLYQNGVKAAKVIIGKYQTNSADNGRRFTQLSPLLEFIGSKVGEVDADDPTCVVTSIEREIRSVDAKGAIRVAFDVSGASSTFILSVMAALTTSRAAIELDVLYSTAKAYDSEPQGDSLTLSGQREHGIGAGPFNAPFTGHHHDHLPNWVIAIPTFYTDRLEACLSNLNVGPMTGAEDDIFWLLPSTDAADHSWRQTRTKAAVEAMLVRRLGYDEDERPADDVIRPSDMESCSVLDSGHTARILIEQIDKHSGRNIAIVHMGSKMQAIGVALACAARSEVAAYTARPVAFDARKYSEGVGQMYKLSFSSLVECVDELRNVGAIVVEAA